MAALWKPAMLLIATPITSTPPRPSSGIAPRRCGDRTYRWAAWL